MGLTRAIHCDAQNGVCTRRDCLSKGLLVYVLLTLTGLIKGE